MDINDVKNTFVKDVFPVFTKQGWEKYFKPAFTKEGFNRHFAEVVKTMYTNIDFKGRTSRSQYWYFSLYYLILAIAAGILDGILFGGILGMLLAIPSYTVLRVFAKEFFSQFRLVRKLTEKI